MTMTLKDALWGQTQVYEAANVEQAVELAQAFKAEGRYDWFRGQVRDWPPVASLFRAKIDGDKSRSERADRRLWMFIQWTKKTPELKHLVEQGEYVHDFFAILQHYGIPTYYIDFTTDPAVAGFFSADTKTPAAGGQSVIYCLNTAKLKDTWSDLSKLDDRQDAELELVTIDVRNLWRLQAQRGTFVYVNYNWDVDYPLDRIIFPYTGPPAVPTRDRIYPEHKSPLEEILDQYFSLEQTTFANEEMIEWLKKLRGANDPPNYAVWRPFERGIFADAFVDAASLRPLPSWEPQALAGWTADPHEDFFATVGNTLRFRLKPDADGAGLRRTVSFAMKQILRSEPNVRTKAVDWTFEGLPASLSAERLNAWFRVAWNGMRRLPYSNDDIAEAFGSIAALALADFGRAGDQRVDDERFAGCFAPSLRVGFSYEDNSGSIGYTTHAAITGCLRPDMADLLTEEHRHRASAPMNELFKIVYNPSVMFDFEPFKAVFAREIIPAQVVADRSPTLCNPARVAIFGNP